MPPPQRPEPEPDAACRHHRRNARRARGRRRSARRRPRRSDRLKFHGSARDAALDLALADPRFAPDVLEAVARRAVHAWAQAVDGGDTALESIASGAAICQLLYAGDEAELTRVVVRGPTLMRLSVTALHAQHEPPLMDVEAQLRGRRYVENRDTAAVISGSQTDETTFTELWTFALAGPASAPWRLVAAGAGASLVAY